MNHRSLFGVLFVFALFGFAPVVSAATLSLVPASVSVPVGGTLTLSIVVSSGDQSMNAASGVLSFPTDRLSVVSISKTSSIFSLWVQDPSFSNADGTVNFEGVVLNPGFSGSSGRIMSVTMRAKAPGAAHVSFSSGSVLANDGQGTNILTGLGSAEVSVSEALVQQAVPQATDEGDTSSVTPPAVSEKVLQAPLIDSKTHPNEGMWYSSNSAELSWVTPGDVTGIAYDFSKNINLIPKETREVVGNVSFDLTNRTDGVWYFAMRYRTALGWSFTTRRIVRVDRTPPAAFTVLRTDQDGTIEPRPKISFSTSDDLSGIFGYDVRVDGGAWVPAQSLARQGSSYELGLSAPGSHSVTVRARDGAGNSSEAAMTVSVIPLPMPTITSYTEHIAPPRSPLSVSGFVSLPSSTSSNIYRVVISLKNALGIDRCAFEASVLSDGSWTGECSNYVEPGDYDLVARLVNSTGSQSFPIDAKRISVGSWISSTLTDMGGYGALALVAVIILAILAGAIVYLYSRVAQLKFKTAHEIRAFERRLRGDVTRFEHDLSATAIPDTVDLSASARTARRKKITGDAAAIEREVADELKNLKDL